MTPVAALRRLVRGLRGRCRVPNVMIRKNAEGKLLFYVAKKDMEETVASVQHDSEDEWGGEVELTDGSKWYIDPVSPPPEFPTTLRFKRAD